MLGYTQVTWDNESGKEKTPVSADKYWAELTQHEQAACIVLGYTKKVWDNDSGKEKQPAVAEKSWANLTTCGGDVLFTSDTVGPPMPLLPISRLDDATAYCRETDDIS